ncbi:T9SS type A sorting domain-containing protein [Polaribacter pectinis]|uniref:T9SS type A sorting domain-containing protein n=1 Tax=Polaribacter pectinis TaxID=2738844 RepID=A0A7G9L7L4_9FLAO|nr:T9SS type A sorting domain-containing protein [Polaribacter pectinis]QNM84613.1 T9SS type A sorting domain-containing protein [Polaribacter pectinis]
MKKILLLVIYVIAFQLHAQTYMYGTTYEGGANGLGIIYRVDQNGQNFQKVFDFTTSTGGKPLGGLTLANGKLYGFTTEEGPVDNPGATAGFGSFFSFDPLTNNLTVIESLDDKSIIGSDINHSPLLANDGKLYIISAQSEVGVFNSIISTYDLGTQAISVLATLDRTTHGQGRSKLMQASNNHFYIATSNGGTNDFGTITRWNTSTNQLEELFNSTGPGESPNHGFKNAQNGLIESSDGYLYGTSTQGGDITDVGVLFRIKLDGTDYSALEVFKSGIQDQGFYPYSGLTELNGLLYGNTSEENIDNVNAGTLFTYNLTTGVVDYFYTLDLEGYTPKGTMTLSTNNRLYFTTTGENGGNNGSLIEYNPINGNVTQRHSFNGTNGSKPYYDELAVVDFTSLSIDESSLLDNIVNTYPNPFQDVVNIKVEGSHLIETIKILDLKGSELYIDNSKSNESNVNTSFLSSGVYLLYIQTDLGSTTRKIIKE